MLKLYDHYAYGCLKVILSLSVLLTLLAVLLFTPALLPAKKFPVSKKNNPDPIAQIRARNEYGKIPLSFEKNQGQSDERVNFVARGRGYNLFLMPDEAVLTLHRKSPVGEKPEKISADTQQQLRNAEETVAISMKLDGANTRARASGVEKLAGKINYYLGNRPEQWRTDIPIFARVRYEEVYPGIDLQYYGNQQELEYDFEVAPGADPRLISLSFTGADRIEIDAEGALILHTPGGEIRHHKPRLWQEIEGRKNDITGRYIQTGPSRIGFEVGSYDPDRLLVIDPVLVYSTYFGGARYDEGFDIAVDSNGSAHIVGSTNSAALPAGNTYSGRLLGGNWTKNVFVLKLNPAGDGIIYCTYLGGTGLSDQYPYGDYGRAIALDKFGNAHVTGETFSDDFPVQNAIQPKPKPHYEVHNAGDAFITKLNGDGTLNWSTYHGGENPDGAFDIAVDGDGAVIITGYTGNKEQEFAPVPSSWKFCSASFNDHEAFVTKFNSTGSAILFRTCLADNDSYGQSVAVDKVGNVYLAGYGDGYLDTSPTAFQPDRPFGYSDVFVIKLSSSGSVRVFATWLGGSGTEAVFITPYGYEERQVNLAVGPDDTVYVAGYTNSTDFPMPVNPDGAWERSYQGGAYDGFVARLSAGGSFLLYSTYLGGSGSDGAYGIAVDNSGIAYVTGYTSSADFPQVEPLQPGHGGSGDVFVLKLNIPKNTLDFSTFLGGNFNENSYGIAIDSLGDAYIAGWAVDNFPTTPGALQVTPNGGLDSIVTKIGFQPEIRADLAVTLTDNPDPVQVGQNLTFIATATNNGPDPATGVTLTSTLFQGATVLSVNSSQGNCATNGNIVCGLGNMAAGSTATVTLVVKPGTPGNFATTATVTGTEADPAPGNNTAIQNTAVIAPDLTVTKVGIPAQILLCQKSDWTITVTNVGEATATGVTLTDTLPPDITFISATSSQGSCSGTGPVTCALGSINKNATATVTIRIQPNLIGQFTNTVSVTSNEPDTNPNDNTATGVINVSLGPIISSITPSEAPKGSTSIELKIEGIGFTPGTAISFKPSDGIELIAPMPPDYGYVSPTELKLRINIAADAVLGEREIFVTRPDEACGGNRPFNVFSVTGIAAIAVSPETHDFGTVTLGESRTATITISNPGNDKLRLYAVTSSNPHFKVDLPEIPYTIAVADSANVTATFTPTAPGEHTATLLLCSNAVGEPAAPVTLRGTVPGAELKETLKTDDGTVETGAVMDGLLMVNRLTPSSYPATLQTLRVFFGQFQGMPSPVGQPIRLVAFADPAGTGQPPADRQLIVDQPVVIPTIPANGGFIEFPIQPVTPLGLNSASVRVNSLTINSGDLYVGFQAPTPSNGVVFAGDSNGQQQERAFFSTNSGTSFDKFIGVVNQQGTITQANIMIQGVVGGAGVCTYVITPVSQAFTESGGNAVVSISAPSGCQWTAGSNDDWIIIDPSSTGSGNGTAGFSVAAGVVPRRSVILIAGQSFTVAQAEKVASVSGASYSGSGLASEAIAAAFGVQLATVVEVASTIPLPTSLLGTTVRIRDSLGIERLAPLFFVSPQQVNYQIPFGTAPGTTTVTIISNDGTTSIGTGQSDLVAPGLFAAEATGTGLAAAYVIRVKSDGSQLIEPIYSYDAANQKFTAVPVDLGIAGDQVYLVLFGTGFRNRTALSAVIVTLGGTDAQVLYAGPQGGFIGLDQANVLIPNSLAGRGLIEVVLIADGRIANKVSFTVK